MAIYFTQNTNNVEDIEQMNNVIDKVNKVNTEATSNIGQLTELNTKAEDLSNNIQQALPINTELKENIKVGQPLVQEVTTKNTELQASLEKTKEFIDGLDGSQNIPQLRLDVIELQNGLKSNQALAYAGSSINAENTLEGRTEGMKIKGRTLLNIHSKSNYSFATSIPQENYTLSEGQNFCEVTIKKYPSSSYYYINAGTINFDLLKPNQKYTLLAKATDGLYPSVMTGGYEFPLTSGGTSFKNGVATMTTNNLVNGSKGQILYINLNGGATYKQELRDVMIFEGDLSIIPCSYFEGIKSFGEAEQEGDKYKISILSTGKNLNSSLIEKGGINAGDGSINNGLVNFIRSKDFIKVQPNTNIVVSGGYPAIFEYDSNFNFIKFTSGTKILTTPSTNFIKYHIESINLELKVMIEEGTQATTYIPYYSNKKDILIKEPLRSVGSVSDELYEDNGQVKVCRNFKQYAFTGDENFIKQNTYGDVIRFDFTCIDIKPMGYITSNNFIKGIIGTEDLECINIHGNSKFIQFQIKANKLTSPDVTGFKAWLKANPTTVVYQLATPTVEIVENCIDIDLDTYQEKTYFNILNSLSGTLDFKVPSNIGSVVQNMAKEVNNIWDVINNMILPGMADIVDKTVQASLKLVSK